MFIGDLRRAVLEALAYSEIFEFPLRLEEIHRFMQLRATLEQVKDSLRSLDRRVGTKDGYYFLIGRADIVKIRRQRERYSQTLLPVALKFGRLLGSLPFVRMVALTGSLAVLNVSKNVDFDYMLVTVPGRLWTGRAFALLLNRVTRTFGHTLCPNLIVTETALEWPLHDLYSARELYQMIPITGMEVYKRLINANAWARDFLPNGGHDFPGIHQPVRWGRETKATEAAAPSQAILELPLRGELGNRLEHWEMGRKITRLSKQAGFGEETVFNAEVCQGNFHHHRKWTRELFEKKLTDLDLHIPEAVMEVRL